MQTKEDIYVKEIDDLNNKVYNVESLRLENIEKNKEIEKIKCNIKQFEEKISNLNLENQKY